MVIIVDAKICVCETSIKPVQLIGNILDSIDQQEDHHSTTIPPPIQASLPSYDSKCLMRGAMPESSDNEWKTVTKNDKKRIARSGRRKGGANKGGWQEYHGKDTDSSTESHMSKSELDNIVSQCRLDLQSTKFFAQLQEKMMRRAPPASIVCFGIGNFGRTQSTPSAPLWQLVCALLLREAWKDRGREISIYYYEPFMTPEEEVFLNHSRIQVIAENERGRRVAKEATVFFMPHCPLGLYSNLLFANRHFLHNIVILGNSLTAYANRLEQNEHTALLGHLLPFWEEHLLPLPKDEVSSLPGQFEQAFNDTAIVCFSEINDAPELPESVIKGMERAKDEPGELL